jgi:hypothetical protein
MLNLGRKKRLLEISSHAGQVKIDIFELIPQIETSQIKVLSLSVQKLARALSSRFK